MEVVSRKKNAVRAEDGGCRQKGVEFSISVCYNTHTTQGSYIGNTTASQVIVAPIRKPAVSNAFSAFQNRISENVTLFVMLSKYFAGLVYR